MRRDAIAPICFCIAGLLISSRTAARALLAPRGAPEAEASPATRLAARADWAARRRTSAVAASAACRALTRSDWAWTRSDPDFSAAARSCQAAAKPRTAWMRAPVTVILAAVFTAGIRLAGSACLPEVAYLAPEVTKK